VKFFGHYGAAAACTPVRSTILTGLYTHQTGILNTYFDNGQKDQANTLNPAFLTWGKALRRLGYQTAIQAYINGIQEPNSIEQG
jgi:arylsulfatase A-like enzyme